MEKEADDREREEQAKLLPGEFPWLMPLVGYGGSKHVAKNIRIELKRAFPSVKFSVTKDDEDAVDIQWIDGPSHDSIETITAKYQYQTVFNDIFGGCRYIFLRREESCRSVK